MSHVAKRYHPVDEKPSQATDALSVNIQTPSGVGRSGRWPVPFGTGRPSRSTILASTFVLFFAASGFLGWARTAGGAVEVTRAASASLQCCKVIGIIVNKKKGGKEGEESITIP